MVPNEPRSAFATSPEPLIELPHALYREDDNGARFLIACYATQAEAEAKAAELARGGHKQHYFVQPLGQNVGGSSCERVT
ncbi:MAG: SPOR domain-containing protein [Verrucomicrobiaceae bacterium]|nr:SPOR domain-containing protein [Verrucomicrobiaceae bacterium]